MLEQSDSYDVMQVLKTETLELHRSAERHDFQQAMIDGTLPQAAYVAFLSQMWVVHRVLEDHLHRLRDRSPFCTVIRDYHFREPLLMQDLGFFDQDTADIRECRGTTDLLGVLNHDVNSNELAVLGYHYVLEGSTNGSKFVARNVQQAYGLSPGAGVSYLEPHGSQQPANWAAFKADMGQLQLSAADIETMVHSAKSMFRGFIGISEDLWGEYHSGDQAEFSAPPREQQTT